MKRFSFFWGMALFVLIASCASLTAGENDAAETITLAENGKTSYVITLPENPSAVQETAANELASENRFPTP